MEYRKTIHLWSVFFILFATVLSFNIKSANAVADININVTDSGQPLGGATISLTFPDGTTQTVTDDDDDGQIGMVLRTPGRYQMTITTADGRTETTSFTAPKDGSVTVGYDAATGRANVNVNQSSQAASTNSSPFSVGLYGGIGFTNWDGQFDNSGSVSEGDSDNMTKLGIGGELRYDLPNAPLFLTNRFFYHAKGGTDPFQSGGSYDLRVRERWKNQMMVGWAAHTNDAFTLAILGGITLAKVRMEILLSDSLVANESKLLVAPTLGMEMSWALANTENMFFVLGFTAALMNSINYDAGSNQVLKADNNLQWDAHTGFRIQF